MGRCRGYGIKADPISLFVFGILGLGFLALDDASKKNSSFQVYSNPNDKILAKLVMDACVRDGDTSSDVYKKNERIYYGK